MNTGARRWRRWTGLAALAAAALAAAAMPSCGGDGNSGSGGAGGSGVASSSSSQASSSSSQASSSSSQSSSGSGGGSPCTPNADACDGVPYDLMHAMTLTIEDTTSNCGSDYQGYCGIGQGSGPDMVYAVRPVDGDGTMHVTLDALPWKGVVYAFAPDGCGKPNKVIACKEAKGGTATFALKVTNNAAYSIVVDGRDITSGKFKLTVELLDPKCGDGVIDDPVEDCDFGPKDSSADGCDMTCHFIPPTPMEATTDSCPPPVVAVTANAPILIPGFTSGYTDDYQPCGAMGGGPDRVFGFSLKTAGTLTVTAAADFDVVLAAYTTCGATLDGLLACSDGLTPDAAEQLSLVGPAGATFFVVVDGYDAQSFGSFTLTATLK